MSHSGLPTLLGRAIASGPLPIFFKRLMVKNVSLPARRDFVFVKDILMRLQSGSRYGVWAISFSSGSDIPIIDLYNAVVKKMKINDYPEPEIKKLSADDASSILLDPLEDL